MNEDRRTGPAAAAALGAGIACVVLGLLTVLCCASAEIKQGVSWWRPAGCLSGRAGITIVVWLISWFVFHRILRRREFCFDWVLVATGLLLALGLLLTFPLVAERLGPGFQTNVESVPMGRVLPLPY